MDALAARIKAKKTFKVLEYALVNEQDDWKTCIWKAQYPDQRAINDERERVGPAAWEREYKLKVVAEEDQIITPEDIHYYDEIPKNGVAALKGHGIDLAISQKENADYTTIVSGEVFYVENAPKVFVRANPYNEHVTFHNFLQRVRDIPGELKGANIFFVEDVAYQKAAIQEMERLMLPVVAMKPQSDKRSRLQVVAQYIKNGTVLFPRSGCEQLLGQMFNLGVEAHDDLCLAAGTMIATPLGDRPIETIRAGDTVITPLGIKKVLAAAKTGEANTITVRGLEGTGNHPVFVEGCGFTRLDALDCMSKLNTYKPASALKWKYQKLLSSMESNTVSWEGKGGITSLSTRTIANAGLRRDFTSRFGSFITRRQFLPALRFIIKTAILITTTLATWIAYRAGNIVTLSRGGSMKARQKCSSTSKVSATSRKNGTPHQKDGDGIANKQSVLRRIAKFIGSLVNHAARTSNIAIAPRASALTFVTTATGPEDIPSTSSNATRSGIRITPNTCDKRITELDSSEKKPVYNLTVEDVNCYYANGILVGNCDGLVWLIWGLVDQGLELPKIHWI